ncbi:SapC family protein [Rheinheimera sp.]|jgi:hypothetical protein|uniref:SapC family protein n=1 Tax=Rheinheimera sp. TaxID=1869214 RepID=UPI0026338D83|nr:SapC family protein [Rheinheimera sp.]MCA1930937.1 SapC family protein [Rheinheimera sp.]
MSNNVLLNSVEHRDLKVITARSAQYGDAVWFAITFPREFRTAQAHYPIFFHKDSSSNQFFAVTLFGFQDKENLFLQQDNWKGCYIPLMLRRQPFLIGQQLVREDGIETPQRVIHIDLDNPRVSHTEGEALFLPFGGSSPYLDEVASMLETIHHGMQDSKDFMAALLEHQLLESFTLDLTFSNGQKQQLAGFYTIHEDNLAALPAETLALLHQKGYLQAIYMAIASQANIRHLLQLKNKQFE